MLRLLYFLILYVLTGRTGRAGRKGQAVTFFTEDDKVNLRRFVINSPSSLFKPLHTSQQALH